jgi:Flp pilus assembly protein TadG
MALLKRLRRDESGVAIIEFALVLPLLLLLILGVIDFGKAINYWIDETHLANAGSRWAVVDNWPGKGSGTTLQQAILKQADTGELRGQVEGTQGKGHAHSAVVCISFPNGTHHVGDPVEVRVSYDYRWLHFITSQVKLATPSTSVAGSSTMRIEANLDTDVSPYSSGCYPA